MGENRQDGGVELMQDSLLQNLLRELSLRNDQLLRHGIQE
jgi:hypothetical protein